MYRDLTRRVLTSALFCLCFTSAMAQTQRKLYYFISAKGKVGVRDGKGKEVIPALFTPFGERAGDKVTDDVLFFLSNETSPYRPGYSSGFVAYSRSGERLFTPFLFDNGPDYISEGLFRIVKDDKIGFANRTGTVVFQPQFSFATPFLHGLSFFCNDCHFYLDSLVKSEHNLRLTPGTWGIAGRDGTILATPRIRTGFIQFQQRYHWFPPGPAATSIYLYCF